MLSMEPPGTVQGVDSVVGPSFDDRRDNVEDEIEVFGGAAITAG